MILTEDCGHTLRCSGCRAYISLTRKELSDLDGMLDIKSAMKERHIECDSFRDPVKARASIKAKRAAARLTASEGDKR